MEIFCGEIKGAFVRGSSTWIRKPIEVRRKEEKRIEGWRIEGNREMDGLRRTERTGDWRVGLKDDCSEGSEEAMCVEDCGRRLRSG